MIFVVEKARQETFTLTKTLNLLKNLIQQEIKYQFANVLEILWNAIDGEKLLDFQHSFQDIEIFRRH